MSDLAKRIREQAAGVMGANGWEPWFNLDEEDVPILLNATSPWENYGWWSSIGTPKAFQRKVRQVHSSPPHGHLDICHYPLRESGLRKTLEKKFEIDQYFFDKFPGRYGPPVQVTYRMTKILNQFGEDISVVFSTIGGQSPIFGPQKLMQEFMDESKESLGNYQRILGQVLSGQMPPSFKTNFHAVHLYDLLSKPKELHLSDRRKKTQISV